MTWSSRWYRLVVINSFLLHVFDIDTAADVAVSYGKSFVGVFCWAWPRSSCCFVDLETKRKSGWGICGSSWFVILRFCVLICLFTGTGQLCWVSPFSPLISLSGPCHRAFTAKLEEKKEKKQKTKTEAKPATTNKPNNTTTKPWNEASKTT